VNSLWRSKQTGSSLWNCFDTVLQDMSADGNCISAELDQFLSEPLISRQVEDEHAHSTGFLSCHHSHRNSWHHHLPASHQRGSSVQLMVTLYLTTAVSSTRKSRDIDLLEIQPPPLGRVTFQLVVKCWSDSFDSFWL